MIIFFVKILIFHKIFNKDIIHMQYPKITMNICSNERWPNDLNNNFSDGKQIDKQ